MGKKSVVKDLEMALLRATQAVSSLEKAQRRRGVKGHEELILRQLSKQASDLVGSLRKRLEEVERGGGSMW